MDRLDKSGVVIDTCSACQGFWLDRGELERMIARRASGNPSGEELRGALERMIEQTPEIAATADMDCPQCRRKIGKISFRRGEASVVGDKCAACGGLWLDSGEMGLLFALVQEERQRLGAVGIALVVFGLVVVGVVAVLLFRIFG